MPDAGAAARPAITRLPVPTIAEGWALAVAALSLLILYGSNGMAREVGRDFAANPAAAAWLFMPHLILIAVIISGLRPLAALLQAFILTFACLIGLGAWVSSIGSSHASEGVGLFVALQIVLMERYAPRFDVVAFTLVEMIAAFGGLLVIALALGQLETPHGWTVWGALLVTGVFASAFAFLAQTWAQRRVTATRTALAFSLEPVWTAFFGYTLAGDRLGAWAWAGCAAIFAGVLVAETA